MLRSVLWLGHDNEVDLELREADANLEVADYDAISRVVLILRPVAGGDDITLDSDVDGAIFSWGSGGPGAKLVIEGSRLDDAGVPAADYWGRLVAYSGDQAEGIVWTDFPPVAPPVETYLLHVKGP